MDTMKEALAHLVERRRSTGHRDQSVTALRRRTSAFLRWLEATHDVTDPRKLRPEHLRNYQKHLSNRITNRGAPLAAGSINGQIWAARALIGFLADRHLVSRKLTTEFIAVKEPKSLPKVLDHACIRKRLDGIDVTNPLGCRDRALLELLYSSAVRNGEVTAIKLTDVDFNNAVLLVHGKGGKERVVPFGRTSMRTLLSYVNAVRPYWAKARESDALFLGRGGSPLTREVCGWVVKRHFGDVAPWVTPHVFRRSCTTELIRSNANLYHVKEMLGHESLDTLQPYTRLTINDLRKTHAQCHPREKDPGIRPI